MQILSQWRLGFIERVYRVRVEGAIDQKLQAKEYKDAIQLPGVCKKLGHIGPLQSWQASILLEDPQYKLKDLPIYFALPIEKISVPIVGFAEDQCLGSANLILTAGVKSYANPFSMIGDVGCNWSRLWYSRLAQRHNVKQEYVYAGENKVKLNPFEEIRPESKEWVESYIKGLHLDLTSALQANRNSHFARNNLKKEDVEREIFSKGIIDPSKAVELGLLDGVRNIDQQLRERYSSIPVRQINKVKKSLTQRLVHSL